MYIKIMDATARRIVNSNTGYDQHQRWTFNPSRDGKTIIRGREADCSSFCAAVVKSAYPALDVRDPIYTGNLKTRFEAVGFQAIKYRNLSQLRAGDFVLSPGYHVEYVHSDGRMYSAAIDERGRLRGGRAGNQTGRETRATNKYIYSKGWRWILRPPTTTTTTSTPQKKGLTVSEANRIIKAIQDQHSLGDIRLVVERAVKDRASATQLNAVFVRQREYQAEVREMIDQIAQATGTSIDYDKVRAAAAQGAKDAIADGIHVEGTVELNQKEN